MPPRRYRPRRPPRPVRKRAGGAAVELPSSVLVKDFAETLGVSPGEIIKELIRNGIFATVNQSIDFDTASLVAAELGYETAERGAADRAAAADAVAAQELVAPGTQATNGDRKPSLW